MLSFFLSFFFCVNQPLSQLSFSPYYRIIIDNSISYCPPRFQFAWLVDWPATKTFWIKDLVNMAIHILVTGVTSTTYHVRPTHHTCKWHTKKKKKKKVLVPRAALQRARGTNSGHFCKFCKHHVESFYIIALKSRGEIMVDTFSMTSNGILLV
jgi:hypothetical protein